MFFHAFIYNATFFASLQQFKYLFQMKHLPVFLNYLDICHHADPHMIEHDRGDGGLKTV